MHGRRIVHPPLGLILVLAVLVIGLAGCTTPATPPEDTPAPAATQPPTAAPTDGPTQTPTPRSPATSAAAPASPLQPEATTTPTAAPPTPSPTAAPIPTSSEVDGWLLYENEYLGYRFSYPPEARIRTQGVTGFPTDELPPNKTSEAYRAELEEKYPKNLCVTVTYESFFISFVPSYDGVGKYTVPCGITGIGDFEVISQEQSVVIDGTPLTSTQWILRGGEGAWRGELFRLSVNDDMRVDFGSANEVEEDEFLEWRPVMMQIVESLRVE